MSHLFLRNTQITKDTREQDLPYFELVINEGTEDMTFVKEDMEPLTPPVDEVVKIELIPLGGFISLTVEELKRLKINVDYYLNRLEVKNM